MKGVCGNDGNVLYHDSVCVCVCVCARARVCVRACVCVLVAQSSLTLCDPWTVANQAYLSMEFSKQEYWSG